jgi:exopolyphosphatase/guanosine-5'-triphosphate,3'-diphosphate pyrophosphatase
MRIAAIDIGSNSIHMVIASAHRPPAFEVVDREREVVQIGRGSFADRRLRHEPMQRTAAALRRFVQLARRMQVDRIVCTATAAVREASNGGEFLQLCREWSGITPRVIPAAEEGRIIHLAVRSALRVPPERSLVVDIGGGSTQLVASRASGGPRVVSVPLGALRLTERFITDDPPGAREVARLQREIRRVLREAFARLGELDEVAVYGSSGAVHALAHAAHGLEHGERLRQLNGHVLDREALRRLARRLLRMPRAQRERLPEVDAPRAEIIVPGALVLLEVLDRAGADGITLSDFGLREGLVLDWMQHHTREVSVLEEVGDVRLRSVLALVGKFGPDGPHPAHVADLSLVLFDALAPEHGIGPEGRELLRFAALLHDVGSAIGYDGHAQHSAYVIRQGNLRGLSEDEIEIIAQVARFHGKARPRRRDEAFRALPRRTRRTVRWLAAILRVAEGLDRSHYQLVRGVRIVRRSGTLSLVVRAQRDAQLELWGARRRTRELERLTGATVRIVAEARRARGRTRRTEVSAAPRRALQVVNGTAATPRAAAARTPTPRRSAAPPDQAGPARTPAPPEPGAGRAAPPDRARVPARAGARAARARTD